MATREESHAAFDMFYQKYWGHPQITGILSGGKNENDWHLSVFVKKSFFRKRPAGFPKDINGVPVKYRRA